MTKKRINIIIGFLILLINSIWTINTGYLFYGYHLTDILWFYMYPDWVLILNIIFGLSGIIIGVGLIKNKIELKNALIIDLPVLILGFLISYFIPM